MIEVKHLTKRYGSSTQKAVDDLSFTINDGVIYGFLGPNGAGKSTTMNIITGCLGATEGSVTIDGHDIFEEPLEAKKRIGYLPELPPLYMDMTPYEYLSFVAKAKHVPRDRREEEIENACRKTHIVEMAFRQIKNLSKGYKQRVGIAQAIIGSPSVIILDEPTVGLDPGQVIEIRELIRELGKEHTVIFSSHILSEVQAVCDSVLIIDHGRLVISGTLSDLDEQLSGTSTVSLTVMCDEDAARSVLSQVPGVTETGFENRDGELHISIVCGRDADIRQDLFRAFAAADIPILNMARTEASLEEMFLEVTRAQDNAQKGEE